MAGAVHTRAVASALIVALASAPVLAAPPGTKARAEARKHFTEGKRLQEKGQLDRAIAEYETANDLAPHPELIFNIAQCHRLAGDKKRAVDGYIRYLASSPKGRAAPEAKRHVAVLRKALAAEKAMAPPPPPPPAEPEPEPVVAALPPAPPPEVAPAPVAEDRGGGGRPLRVAGLATAGGGLLLLGGGLVFALRARSISDDVDALHEEWDEGLYQSGERAQTISTVLFIAGGAAVVTGAVLTILDLNRPRPERVTILPTGTGAVVRVTF